MEKSGGHLVGSIVLLSSGRVSSRAGTRGEQPTDPRLLVARFTRYPSLALLGIDGMGSCCTGRGTLLACESNGPRAGDASLDPLGSNSRSGTAWRGGERLAAAPVGVVVALPLREEGAGGSSALPLLDPDLFLAWLEGGCPDGFMPRATAHIANSTCLDMAAARIYNYPKTAWCVIRENSRASQRPIVGGDAQDWIRRSSTYTKKY